LTNKPITKRRASKAAPAPVTIHSRFKTLLKQAASYTALGWVIRNAKNLHI
jgi:hypothetical protein